MAWYWWAEVQTLCKRNAFLLAGVFCSGAGGKYLSGGFWEAQEIVWCLFLGRTLFAVWHW